MTTVTLFEHRDFEGKSLTLRSEDPNLADDLMKADGTWNDRVSAIRVEDLNPDDQNTEVALYGNSEYDNGSFWTKVHNWRDSPVELGEGDHSAAPPLLLPGEFPNEQLSSLQVPDGMKVTLFEHPNYSGSQITFYSDIDDLSKYDLIRSWDNQASSLKVEGGSAQFYSHPNHSTGVFGWVATLEANEYPWVEDVGIKNDDLSSVFIA